MGVLHDVVWSLRCSDGWPAAACQLLLPSEHRTGIVLWPESISSGAITLPRHSSTPTAAAAIKYNCVRTYKDRFDTKRSLYLRTYICTCQQQTSTFLSSGNARRRGTVGHAQRRTDRSLGATAPYHTRPKREAALFCPYGV